MTATIIAHIFDTTMTATSTDRLPMFSADRPESLADADRELARHSLVRTAAWDLGGHLSLAAPVRPMDNTFNGVVAVDLWDKVGTSHGEWDWAQAQSVENGDLVSDPELSEVYLVAGSSTESGVTKLHQVSDGKEWADRYTGEFDKRQVVRVARKR